MRPDRTAELYPRHSNSRRITPSAARHRALFCAALLLAAAAGLPAQDGEQNSAEQNSAEPPDAVSGAAPSGAEPSLLVRWEEALQYGIDSEIAEVLEQIEQSGERSLDELIVERFAETRSDALRSRIVRHFTTRESDALASAVRDLIVSDVRLTDDLLQASAAYLSRVVGDTSPDLLERYGEIAEDANVLAATVAIDAIGRNGSPEAVSLLLDLYSRLEGTDTRAAVIRALGETRSEDALPLLTQVATDEFEQSALRQYAAESLGRIGADESFPVLTGLLDTEDSVLRSYVTFALGFYETDEAAAILEDALRDSFWRVRVAALEALGEQGRAAAVPAIAYKARRDPERPVRQEAIRTLARIGDEESRTVLRELLASDRTSENERILIVEELGESPATGNLEPFAGVIESEWEREGSRLLDAVGRMVSEHGDVAYEPIYLKLLEHPNFVIRIYGMRGIGSAGIRSQADVLKQVARENPTGLMRRTALASLELLGIEYDPDGSPAPPETDGEADDPPTDTTAPATESEPENATFEGDSP